MKLFRIITLLLLGPTASLLHAQQAPELSADSPIAYSEETGLLIATGNARFVDDNTIVVADLIRYDRATEEVEAIGNVSVTREGLRLLADSLTYDSKSRSFSARDFRIGYPPLFIEGKRFNGNLDAVDFEDISVFFREPVQSAPRIRVKSGRWVDDEYLSADGIHFDILGKLGLPLPGITYAFGKTSFDVDASLGYTDFLGAYAQSAWRYPLSPTLAVGGNIDLYSSRGLLIGPGVDWQSQDGLIELGLDTGWIHDHSFADRGFDILGNRIDQDRGFAKATLKARSEQNALQTKVRAEFLSDSEVLRDFRENRYYEDPQPDAFAEFTWQKDNLLLSAFARSRLNDGYAFVERVPDLRLEWLPAELWKSGVFLQAQARASRYRLYDPLVGQILFPETTLYSAPSTTRQTVDEFLNRFDTVASLTRPIALPAGWQLTLRGGTRWTRWNDNSNTKIDDRFIGELGWDLQQSRLRVIPVEWNALDLDQLTHRSTLRLQHRWHEWDAQALNLPIAIDRSTYRQYAPLMDLADMRALDTLREGHHLRLAWENVLYGRKTEGFNRRLMSLDLYQDLFENQLSNSLDVDALYARLDISPADWFSLAWFLKFMPDDFQTEAAYFSATVRSADLWSVDIQTEFVEGAIQQYTLYSKYRVGENISLLGAAQYDARIGTWTRQRYGFSRRFGNVWELDVYVSLTDADERQDSLSLGLRVNLLAF